MNFSTLVIFLIRWDFIYAELHPALFFKDDSDTLVELSNFQGEQLFTKRIISLCPARSTSNIEKQLNEISITKKSMFLRDIYEKYVSIKNIKIEICENSFTPALAWNYELKYHEVGFEFYHEREKIRTSYLMYQDFVTMKAGDEGEESQDEDLEFDIENYLEKKLMDLNLNDQIQIRNVQNERIAELEFIIEQKTMVFHWLSVLKYKKSKDQKNRYFEIKKDERIGDHVIPNFDCETYFRENGIEIRKTDHTEKSEMKMVKSQITPMLMFETLAAKKATCVYLNVAFISEIIVTGILKEIDLIIYKNYQKLQKLGEVKLYFGVYDNLQLLDAATQKEIESDDNPFTIDHVPKVIFRLVTFKTQNQQNLNWKIEGVVIIIHNELNSVTDDDRICSTEEEVRERNGGELKKWDEIRNKNSATRFCYICPLTKKVFSKLQVDTERFEGKDIGILGLDVD